MSLHPGEGLFSGLFARGAVAEATSDRAVLQAMLRVELALIRALQTCSLAPAQAADQLQAALKTSGFDLAALGAGAGAQGTPVPALLRALRERLPEPARSHLHAGATSQDIIDTALMLVAREALAIVLDDLDRALRACAGLAQRHRDTLIAGRTLLQDALPRTFGLTAANWLVGLHESRSELDHVRSHVLAAQLGGAVGTLAAYGDRGLDVMEAFAADLELAAPPLPWHTIRTRPARLAGALGVASGVMGKLAHDVVLLAQSEVAECAEGGAGERGGSSAMPHKRNPVAAIAVLACAGQTPGLVGAMLSAMVQEHERGAGSWQAEWQPLLALLTLTGSAAHATAELLEGLQVDAPRMRANLQAAGAELMSESLVGALADRLGRAQAAERVREGARRAREQGRPLEAILGEDEEVLGALGREGLEAALDPERYLGVSGALIDRALNLGSGGGS
jgi:3-carboxy-cis,cis-muconate cycloisomerase